jgi:sugar lactone lactonase YvrE
MTISLDDVAAFGPALQRPECVVATASGDLFIGDGRGGVMVIHASGTHQLILPATPPDITLVPNGIALLPDRSFLLANIGMAGGVWRLYANGRLDPYLTEIEGAPIPQTNFVHNDAAGRCWITVSTRKSPIAAGAYKGMADGYIIVQDEHGARIAAEGIGFTNEAKVAPSGRWLYVVETIARRLIRYPIGRHAALGQPETVTEFTAPAAFPDGLCFDEEGAVWVTTIIRNGLIRVLPDGRQIWILNDTDEDHASRIEAIYQAGGFGGWSAGEGRKLNLPTSMAFGGPDLSTGYLGFLHGTRLMRFKPGIRGAAPAHWLY